MCPYFTWPRSPQTLIQRTLFMLFTFAFLLFIPAGTTQARQQGQQDPRLAQASDLAKEGYKLYAQGTADSLRRAIRKFEESLKIYRQAKDLQKSVALLISLAEVYGRVGKIEKAFEYLKQGKSLMLSVGEENKYAKGLTLAMEAGVYNAIGRKEKALEYYTRALQMMQEVDFKLGEAPILNNLGTIESDMGEVFKAIETFQRALGLSRKLTDDKGIALALTNLGNAYLRVGELEKAQDAYSEALTLMKKYADANDLVIIYNNLGILHKDLGDSRKARELFTEALSLVSKTGIKSDEAITLMNIGLLHNGAKEYQEAIKLYEQALVLFRASNKRKGGEELVLTNMGTAYRNLGQRQKALEMYQKALPLMRSLKDKNGEAGALHNIGIVTGDLGDRRKGIELLNEALRLRKLTGDARNEAVTLKDIAVIERDLGDLAGARRRMESALALVESLRARYLNQDIRTKYFTTVQELYEFYIDLLMRSHRRQPSAGYDGLALQLSERARARALIELLSESQVGVREGAEPSLLERRFGLQRKLKELSASRLRVMGDPRKKGEIAAVAREIEDALTALQQVEAQIRLSSPAYATLTQPQPLTAREIQTRVLDNDTVLFEYRLGAERSFLWVVTAEKVTSHELPGRAEIESLASRTYDLLNARIKIEGETQAQRRDRIARADAVYPAVAARLSQLILSPAATAMGKKRLLVVADGALQYIPFAALPDTTKDGSPLIVSHEIVNAPSASTVDVMRREKRDPRASQKVLAVLADPVFEPDDPRIKPAGDARTQQPAAGVRETESPRELLQDAPTKGTKAKIPFAARGIKRLPGTRTEAEQILALVPASESKGAFDFAANRTAATNAELGHYRYVHFATHGFLDTEYPELSGIMLSMYNERGEPQDGFLQMHEVFNLKLPVELVVLSACQTGIGKEIKGEGLVALTRGFMYAGTPRVVVSLWGVSDAGTPELMRNFYSGILVDKKRPAEALRAAQLNLMSDQNYASPFYWAAFTLQGEWR